MEIISKKKCQLDSTQKVLTVWKDIYSISQITTVQKLQQRYFTLDQTRLSSLNCPIFSKPHLPENETFQKGPYVLLDTTQISSGVTWVAEMSESYFAKVLRQSSKTTSFKARVFSVPSAVCPAISFSFHLKKININFSRSAFSMQIWSPQTQNSLKIQTMGSSHLSTNRTLPSGLHMQLITSEPPLQHCPYLWSAEKLVLHQVDIT